MSESSKGKTRSANTPAGRITKQLFEGLCHHFSLRFEAAIDVLCANAGQKFSERQAYGLMAQALCDVKDENKRPKFILTELPVRRNRASGKRGTPGRVDFLVVVRKQPFAIELKLVTRGLQGNKKNGDDNLQTAWYVKSSIGIRRKDAVGQLKSLDFRTDFFKSLPKGRRLTTTKKFPLLIVCYLREHKAEDIPFMDYKTLKAAHDKVSTKLSMYAGSVPSFNALHEVASKPRAGKNVGRSVTIYGLGFFGGAACFERN